MKLFVWVGVFVSTFVLCSVAFGQASDTTAPVLRAFSFSPATVNTASAAATVTASLNITDDLSGVDQVAITWFNPARSVWYGNTIVIGGQPQWTGTIGVTIPALSQTGTWTPELILVDKAGNVRRMLTADITVAGFPTALIVMGQASDTTAPVLRAFSFSPATVNTASAAATVTASLNITDDLSGVDQVAITWFNPARSVWYGNTIVIGGQPQWTGTIAVTIPALSQTGTWTPELILVDKAGNVRRMLTADITAAGFPTALMVTGQASDTTAPVLRAFSFSPTTVNTASAPATVTAGMTITDDLSGIDQVAITWFNPSRSVWYGNTSVIGGQPQWTGTIAVTIPAMSQIGTWTPELILVDKAGNVRRMPTVDITAAGFPTALTVGSPAPALQLSSQSLSFNSQFGATAPASQTLVVSSVTPVSFTAVSGSSWLTVNPTSGMTPASLSVSLSPAGLNPGVYSGSITVAASAASNSPQNISVTLTIADAPKIGINPTMLNFAYQSGSNAAPSQAVSLTGSSTLAFTAVASGGAWLTVSPRSGTTPATLGVSVSPAGLNTGVYSGSITVSALGASNSPQSIPVTFTVTTAPKITTNPAALNFTYQTGGNAPSSQAVSLTATSAVTFTAVAAGGAWLTVNPTTGTTPASLTVSVSPGGLSPGTYNGSINIAAPGAGNSPQTVLVTLTIASSPTIAVNPTLLDFAYQTGDDVPPPQSVSLTATSAAIFTAVASGGSWLTVNSSSGHTPASLIVSADPNGLSPGVYNGTITVTVPSASNSPQRISVNMTVKASVKPAISEKGVVNGASFTPGISSGSWVSIMGANLAPVTRTWSASDMRDGVLPSSLAGVSVTINGKPAAVYYVSPTQLNVQAPDDASIGPVSVQVNTPTGTATEFANFNQFSPALFTTNGSCVAAVLSDGSVVGRPEKQGPSFRIPHPGDVVMLFGTGFGPATPSRPAGRVIDPAPLATDFTIVIGGRRVDALYGGIVAPGLYQFNVTIPDLPDGDHGVLIQIAGSETQAGIIIPVQR